MDYKLEALLNRSLLSRCESTVCEDTGYLHFYRKFDQGSSGESSPVNSHSMCSNWYYKLIWSRSLHAILYGCNRRCLLDVFKRFQKSVTTSGASGASRLNQSASSFASGTACFIFTIERIVKKTSGTGVVVLYCTYMHPYIYTVSRTTVQLLHRM